MRGWLIALCVSIGSMAGAVCRPPDLLWEPPATVPRILIIGDSMSQGLAIGMGQITDCRAVSLDLRGQQSTGLFGGGGLPGGWLEWSRQYARGSAQHDAVMILIGINETVGLSGSPGDARTREYLTRASDAVTEIVRNLRTRARHVVWVGLPRMGRGDRATLLLDDVIRSAVSSTGAIYVDTRALTEWQGGYHTNVWAGRLQAQAVRHTDGVHFSGTGNNLIATSAATALERASGFQIVARRQGR